MIGVTSLGQRLRILFLTILILFFSITTASSISVTEDSRVNWLIEHGYVTGDSRGYRLDDRITRAEITKMVVESGGFGEFVDGFKNLESKFTDVNISHWANGYINTAFINHIILIHF